jgi:hypothetical protein
MLEMKHYAMLLTWSLLLTTGSSFGTGGPGYPTKAACEAAALTKAAAIKAEGEKQRREHPGAFETEGYDLRWKCTESGEKPPSQRESSNDGNPS